jgi:pantoate--beta-alanine ligase
LRVCRSVAELRVALAGAPRPVGFVPTMGYLHDGHDANFTRCREECATAVASIFVNPLQFNEASDLATYPRDEAGDLERLEKAGVDAVFLPEPGEIYPSGFATRVDVGHLATVYEGEMRPGHFAGVATIVLKLLNIVAPDRAYFGRKDAQQLAVIRRLVRDLDLPVAVVPVETVREPDGLALSSRNVHLSAAERARALGLSRGLLAAQAAWDAGERDLAELLAKARTDGLDYEYLACVDPDDFGRPASNGPAALIAAVRVGKTRLIDNVFLAGP